MAQRSHGKGATGKSVMGGGPPLEIKSKTIITAGPWGGASPGNFLK